MLQVVRYLVVGGFSISLLSAGFAQEKAPDALPEPLTLEYALSLAQDLHPSMQRMDASIQRALAAKQMVDTDNSLEINLEAQARWVEPSHVAPDQHDDHRLGVIARKRLYDFGRQESKSNAANLDLEGQQLRYRQALQEHRLEVMRLYFDVLLADLKFIRDNEEMAVAYIQWDRIQERYRLKQAIDVDVLALETEYQKVRRTRFQSQAMQRQTRARLAAALNRPHNLPANLVPPELPVLSEKLDDFEELQQQALEHNPALQVLRKRLHATQQRLEAARSAYDPSLSGQLEAYSYSRELGSSDKWRAGITLDVPLYTGNRSQAVVAQAKADEYQLQAELKELEYDITQAVLEAWLNIDILGVQRQEMQTRANYEEAALDQSRAIYELELKTDLGFSMVRVSEAEYQARKTDYELAMAWERLKLLTGQLDRAPATANISTPGAKND
ncbi:MAG: TolC family protein [Gammaproteobacteria bacterium]